MQKKLIALAVAGLASAGAYAQSNVTIYGIVDASAYASTGGNKAGVAGAVGTNYGFLSNAVASSRLGFRGTEDLGNGLKAVFNLETELSLANGQMGSSTSGTGPGTFSRAANVGLAGGFGTVTLGRQATPTYAAVVGADALGTNSGGLINAWVYSNVKGSVAASRISGVAVAGTTNDAMASNLQGAYAAGIGYASPVIAGFQAKLFSNVGNNTSGAEFTNNGLRDMSVVYDNAGLKLQATHQVVYGKDTTAPVNELDKGQQKNTLVSASYAFGDATVAAAWVKTKFAEDMAATNDDLRTWTLGGKYKLGATTLGLSYTNTKDVEVTTNKVTQVAALADYSLSKRTSLYALVTRANNSGLATMNGLYSANAASAAGADVTSVALGLKHSF